MKQLTNGITEVLSHFDVRRILLTALLVIACSSQVYAQGTDNPGTTTDAGKPRAPKNVIGQYTRLVVSSTDVIRSMAWWARLGFSPAPNAGNKPDSAMTLTDGQIFITLVKTLQPSPVMMFRTPNMIRMNETLINFGIPLIADIKGPSFGEIRIKSPNAVYIAIRPEGDEPLLTPTGALNPICGRVTELSIGTLMLKTETNFWEMLGFVTARGDRKPYPFAVMTDGRVQVGLHENRDIPTQSITYFSPDMASRIDRLKKSGMEITEEIPSDDGHLGNVILTSPDGQLVFLFEGDQ